MVITVERLTNKLRRNKMEEVIKYKHSVIEIQYDEYCFSPREWDNLGTIIVNSNNRYFGGLNENVTGEIIKRYPLYGYAHSGVSISLSPFSCPWDSGQIGEVVITEDTVTGLGTDSKDFDSCIEAEIKELDDYVRGNCYRFEIKDLNETMSGFIGSDHEQSGLLSEARSCIDWHIDNVTKSNSAKLKAYIQNKVPLDKRELATY